MPDDRLDLSALRRTWEMRRAAAKAVLQRIDVRGLRRPARDPSERSWLEERGESVFIEDEEAGRAAREYYERKYTRPER